MAENTKIKKEDFLKSKKEVTLEEYDKEYGLPYDLEDGEMVVTYLGGYNIIKNNNGEYELTILRSSWVNADLEALEQMLFDWINGDFECI